MPRDSNLKRREQAEDFEAPELMFAELDSLLGYLLRRAQGAMHRDFMDAVADFGLTQKQAAALWLIQANGGVSQVEVAAALGMDRATMMAVTDRLEDRGFVTRKRSVGRPAPSGAVPDAVGAKHLAQVQDAYCRARREIPRDVHGFRARGAARRSQEIPDFRLNPRTCRAGTRFQNVLTMRARRARR